MVQGGTVVDDRMRSTFAHLGCAALLLAACSSESPKPVEPVVTASAVEAVETAVPTAEATAKPAELPPVDFVAGALAAPPAKAPKIAITAPKKDQVVPADKAGDFAVTFTVDGWDVPAGGNHVHLILDGQPYKRIDDPKAPVKLSELTTGALAEGQHILVAFPSRPTHESVKPIGKDVPVAVTSFWVGKKGTPTWKPTDPLLVFSRPKGMNAGPPPAEGILVDFYLVNAELGEGKHSVEATLSGPGLTTDKTAKITSWTPWRVTQPRDGEYTLSMKLLDKAGKVVPGSMNDVKRTFQVDTKAPAPTDHAHPPATK